MIHLNVHPKFPDIPMFSKKPQGDFKKILSFLVGGIPTPVKNMSLSIGMKTFPRLVEK